MIFLPLEYGELGGRGGGEGIWLPNDFLMLGQK